MANAPVGDSKKREQVRRLWYVQERLKWLADEKKLLIDLKKKGRGDLNVRQISRMRAYIQTRSADLKDEVARHVEERKRLMTALKAGKK